MAVEGFCESSYRKKAKEWEREGVCTSGGSSNSDLPDSDSLLGINSGPDSDSRTNSLTDFEVDFGADSGADFGVDSGADSEVEQNRIRIDSRIGICFGKRISS